MDAYLSKKKFIAAQINVLLKTCFFMASKYEEVPQLIIRYTLHLYGITPMINSKKMPSSNVNMKSSYSLIFA